MHVIAIANHKGGTGKTTTAHVLGTLLARRGYQTILIDMDPQMSLTEACGVQGESVAAALAKSPRGLTKIMQEIEANLWLCPSDIEAMTTMQRDLASRMVGRELALKKALSKVANVDVVVIDCPPSMEMLTLNALAAATHVIIPTKPQPVDLRGLRLFTETLWEVDSINPGIYDHRRILVTFAHDYLLHRKVWAAIAGNEVPVFETKIGESVRVAEAPETAQSVVDYAPDNPRTAEYQALCEEVIAWIKA